MCGSDASVRTYSVANNSKDFLEVSEVKYYLYILLSGKYVYWIATRRDFVEIATTGVKYNLALYDLSPFAAIGRLVYLAVLKPALTNRSSTLQLNGEIIQTWTWIAEWTKV